MALNRQQSYYGYFVCQWFFVDIMPANGTYTLYIYTPTRRRQTLRKSVIRMTRTKKCQNVELFPRNIFDSVRLFILPQSKNHNIHSECALVCMLWLRDDYYDVNKIFIYFFIFLSIFELSLLPLLNNSHWFAEFSRKSDNTRNLSIHTEAHIYSLSQR